MKKNKSVSLVEVKFNSEKEKIFVFVKENTPIEVYKHLLNLFSEPHKVYILSKRYVDSIEIIKDKKK